MNKKGQEFFSKKFIKKDLNCRGQAALMDSIFFLTIVATICTSLFFFAINYGLQTSAQIDSFYSSDFAADSLKVISYINVLRDGKSISELDPLEPVQSDYLLALIKEDYADKKKMSEETTKAIANTLGAVLKPFDNSIDYSFFITSESENDFLFLLLATHECEGTDCLSATGNSKDVKRKYFYCTPIDNTVLEKLVFPRVGQVDSAHGKVTLSDSAERDSPGRPFVIALNVWITKSVPELSTQNLETSPDFNCSEIDFS